MNKEATEAVIVLGVGFTVTAILIGIGRHGWAIIAIILSGILAAAIVSSDD